MAAALIALLPAPASRASSSVVFEGSGWGHGVGMSQYGSRAMAVEGWTGKQIIEYYFTGTTVADYDSKIGGWLVNDPTPLWVNITTTSETTGLQLRATASGLSLCQQEPAWVGALSLKNNQGAYSPYVELLEQRLAAEGFNPGAVDGWFDTATDTAVKAYQSAKGLTVDGIVGNQTKNSLWAWDGADRCVVETALTTTVQELVPTADGSECLFGGAFAPGDCRGSVRNMSPSTRLALPQKKVRNGTDIELARGNLRIRPDRADSNNAFQGIHALLQVGIDDYVLGIDETLLSWGTSGAMAALHAQAIASRSYGVGTARGIGPESNFDSKRKDSCWCHLYSTPTSQVYAGWYAETNWSGTWKTAADATRRQVVSHTNYPIVTTFFSSSSGGKTESNVWAGWSTTQLPYLQSVDDPWSLDSANPFAAWSNYWTPSGVASKLGFDELTGVDVIERNPSGTARTVRFVGKQGGSTVVSDRTGAWVARSFGLRSRYFTVTWGDVSTAGTGGSGGSTGPFTDISGSVFVHDITWLYERGLTSGCNPPTNDRYCPDRNVTRGEMAVFIQRALRLPAASGDHFDDDNGKFYEDAANRLYEAGITSGCGARKFCGDQAIPREQMAALLDRALDLDPATKDYFVDDSKSMFQDSINRVAEAGITKGCNPPTNDRFCPTDYVTRGQLAAFLKRALD
jgi:SpoIID/LytB domain protein